MMEESIGTNAGMVWDYLSGNRAAVTPSALAKALKLKGAEVDRALGWLAREGKLDFDTGKRNSVKVALRN